MSYAAHALDYASDGRCRKRRHGVDGAEDESTRVVKGVLLGCALSLPVWAAIALGLRATLG